MGMVAQDMDLAMVQAHLLLPVMVNLKSLSLVNSRDNLANSSSRDNLVNSSNLSRASSSHLQPNSPHQHSNHSDSTGKAEMIYAEMFCAL